MVSVVVILPAVAQVKTTLRLKMVPYLEIPILKYRAGPLFAALMM